MKNNYKIAVLGASSFIGYSFLKFYKKKKNIFGTVSKQYKNTIKKKRINEISEKLKHFNFEKKETFKNIDQAEILINCIGFTKNFNSKKFDINKSKKKFMIYYKHLKKFLKKSKIKLIIHIGSSFEYSEKNKLINENSECNPKSKYGKYKIYEHEKLKALANNNIKFVNIRCFSIFGELNKKDSLFEKIKNNNQIIIKNSNAYIDFLSVFYLNKLLMNVVFSYKQLKKVEIINFCSGQSLILQKLITNLNLNKDFIFKNLHQKSLPICVSNKKMIKFIKFDMKKNIKILKRYLS